MPWGDWVNELPTEFFLAVHIAAFAIGAAFAWTAFKRDLSLLGWGFTLFALAEVSYMTYHLDWTVFLFAHTIAEVLDLTAFVLVFAAAVWQTVDARRPGPGRRRRDRSRCLGAGDRGSCQRQPERPPRRCAVPHRSRARRTVALSFT